MKQKTNEELLELLIEICGEIEAEIYNDKFGLCRAHVIIFHQQKAFNITALLTSRGFDIQKEAQTNEELEYALQFI